MDNVVLTSSLQSLAYGNFFCLSEHGWCDVWQLFQPGQSVDFDPEFNQSMEKVKAHNGPQSAELPLQVQPEYSGECPMAYRAPTFDSKFNQSMKNAQWLTERLPLRIGSI